MTDTKETALAPTEVGGALARFNFSRDQVELIKRTVAQGTTDDELALFMHVCKRTGLDPLARQIYAIKRRQKKDGQWIEVMTIQTGIDGLRLQAERTGRFRGFDKTEWCGQDGVWRDVWLDLDKPPAAARVAALRLDDGGLEPIAIEGIALYQEYVQLYEGKPMARWAAAPAGMLAKCAEALALRRAFPSELAGIFSSEEMAQADMPAGAPRISQPTRKSERAPDKSPKTVAAPKGPVANPWLGDLDEVKASPEKNFWMVSAGGGLLTFFTNQADIKEKAVGAIADARQVRIEWKKTDVGNLEIQTLVLVMDA